jgi:ABC-type sugar transport system permease subunit
VETIVLSNGKSEETYTSLTEIRTPGKYTLYLYDKEGNVREYSFRVRRHINAASVLSILLVIAIIAVGVIFYRRTKNDMNLK